LAQADRLGPKVGGHLALHATFIKWTGWTLAVAVHCYDGSTINIVVAITFITIIWRASCHVTHVPNWSFM